MANEWNKNIKQVAPQRTTAPDTAKKQVLDMVFNLWLKSCVIICASKSQVRVSRRDRQSFTPGFSFLQTHSGKWAWHQMDLSINECTWMNAQIYFVIYIYKLVSRDVVIYTDTVELAFINCLLFGNFTATHVDFLRLSCCGSLHKCLFFQRGIICGLLDVPFYFNQSQRL